MILAIFLTIAGTCKQDDPLEKKQKWIEEVEQSNKDIKKESTAVEEKGSKQPEDVEDLDEQDESMPITLRGGVTSEAGIESITITIYKEAGTVEGEATLWWREDIEVYGEGEETHHSHRYTCEIKLDKGTIFGTIDEDGNINATISGFAYSENGYDPKTGKRSTPEICSLCRERIKNRPETFIWKAKYNEEINRASGHVLPQGWGWFAN